MDDMTVIQQINTLFKRWESQFDNPPVLHAETSVCGDDLVINGVRVLKADNVCLDCVCIKPDSISFTNAATGNPIHIYIDYPYTGDPFIEQITHVLYVRPSKAS